MPGYKRTLEELEQHTVLFWPEEIKNYVAKIDPGERLLTSQETFLDILSVSGANPESWKNALDASGMAGNLFLKHLMVISDIAVEALRKLNPLYTQFPGGRMEFEWKGERHAYSFRDISVISGNGVHTSNDHFIRNYEINDKMYDLTMFLLYGDSSVNSGDFENLDLISKCVMGRFLGERDKVSKFAKERYLFVSSQTRGVIANAKGQALQKIVIKLLRGDLPEDQNWSIISGKIEGVRSSEDRETTFDLVVTGPDGHKTGIEVSFQETSNSTFERKARESQSIKEQLHARGHKLAFVLDGAGNIRSRRPSSATICLNSDCTVGFSPSELRVLANFLRECSGLPALPLLTPVVPPQSQPQQP